MGIEAALEYSRKHGLRALLVARGEDPLVEIYENGASADTVQPLYSGTKSFWGVAALRAQDEGLISFDEPVAETFPAWSEDPWKRRVTPRMLLSLTGGFGFGGLGSSVPLYERALAMDLKTEPGSVFAYGGIQLQVFGAVFARKLAPLGLTPQQYLTAARSRSGRRPYCNVAVVERRNATAPDRRVGDGARLARLCTIRAARALAAIGVL